jgi:hypothetical protein
MTSSIESGRLKYGAIRHNSVTHEETDTLDCFFCPVGIDQGLAVENVLDIFRVIVRKIAAGDVGTKMYISSDQTVEQILGELAQVHDDVMYFFKASRVQLVVDEDSIGENDRIEHVMPMDVQPVDNIVERFYLSLPQNKIAEIQDIDIQQEPLFAFLLLCHVKTRLPLARRGYVVAAAPRPDPANPVESGRFYWRAHARPTRTPSPSSLPGRLRATLYPESR